METITIPKQEYEELKKFKVVINLVESTLHRDDWTGLSSLSADVANQLWDNQYDEIWNDV